MHTGLQHVRRFVRESCSLIPMSEMDNFEGGQVTTLRRKTIQQFSWAGRHISMLMHPDYGTDCPGQECL